MALFEMFAARLKTAAFVVGALSLGWSVSGAASAQGTQASPAGPPSDPGEAIYQSHCAACHDHSDTSRAPTRAALGQMLPQAIEFALTQGKMKGPGSGLTNETRAQLIKYLTGGVSAATATDAWADKMMCPANHRVVDLTGPATVSTFGYDKSNTRALTAAQAGLSKAQLSDLELAWAIAIPGATTMRSQPAVVGKTVFLPVSDVSTMYAFDVSNRLQP